MARRYPKLGSFNGVGAGQTAILNVGTGPTYHNIKLRYKTNANQNTIETDVEEIRLLVNGKVVRRFSAAELNKINAFNGIAFRAGLIPIYFSEPWRRNALGEDTLAWGTANIDTLTIEVDIAAGATAPTLSARAELEDTPRRLQNIMMWEKMTVPVASSGLITLNTLSKKPSEVYHRLHCLEDTAADISDVEITLDTLQVLKATDAENQDDLAPRGFTPASDVFHIVFDKTQRVEDGLPMVKGDGSAVSNFNIDFTMAQANSFQIIAEKRGTPSFLR